jgi:uncharacterized integral membrane protein
MAQFVNCLVIVLLVPPVVVTLFFSPPTCFFAFLAASVIPFFAGKSRRVTDPVAGIPTRNELSPSDFHAWAKLVCSSEEYKRAYDQYVYDANRGYDQKLPLTFSQIKAINYVHASKVLLFILLALDAFCLYDLFFSNHTFQSPVLLGIMIGILWGYALGVYVLWRKCRRYKVSGDLPL